MGQAKGEVILLEARVKGYARAVGWKQSRTRRRHLLAVGADPKNVHMATRNRKGYWQMSQNQIVRHALNNRWREKQGVPDMRAIWIALYYPEQA